jgi:hypothetical protein
MRPVPEARMRASAGECMHSPEQQALTDGPFLALAVEMPGRSSSCCWCLPNMHRDIGKP